ncbi:unnamed protein product [Peronospora destructor]|uniref:Uncharacterized protein n=1 Tax=Peronospora destructor TaxID=86335 RepID=A0AAV0U8U1_9STRA|nr:unnamed protein product [Peronospora destructor]
MMYDSVKSYTGSEHEKHFGLFTLDGKQKVTIPSSDGSPSYTFQQANLGNDIVGTVLPAPATPSVPPAVVPLTPPAPAASATPAAPVLPSRMLGSHLHTVIRAPMTPTIQTAGAIPPTQ